MKIAFVTSELDPYAKVGGLADVARGLTKALSQLGCDVKIFIPRYSSIDPWRDELRYCFDVNEIKIKISEKEFSVHAFKKELSFNRKSKIEIYFVDSPFHFDRGTIYTNDIDEGERFLLFSKAVIEICQRLKWAPDVFHINDWPTGLLPIILKQHYSWDLLFKNTKFLLTIHNIEYQGNFSPELVFNNHLDGKYFYLGGPLEFHGKVSFLKAGIVFSDIITTVSENYAREILTHEFGGGMEQILLTKKNVVYGILNGVDYSEWNPKTDKYIPYKYSEKSLYRKSKNKIELLKTFHLPEDKETPLIGIVSRLVSQKGFDLMISGIDEILKMNLRFVILGSGENKYEDFFRSLAYSFPDKFGLKIGFDNQLAHLIEAGADMFLMPSRYEPCGLNQIYSLKYGTVPIVRKTGGLADTVKDWDYYQQLGLHSGNGFVFENFSSQEMVDAIRRALERYKDKKIWKQIQLNGMKENFSWDISARKYYDLYRKLVVVNN
ncbi:MAG: glycogen synthase GlgA [Ignavibacteria bacterium]|nr:glycogen synthase GlgA [Ignavibacteria bacterium]